MKLSPDEDTMFNRRVYFKNMINLNKTEDQCQTREVL